MECLTSRKQNVTTLAGLRERLDCDPPVLDRFEAGTIRDRRGAQREQLFINSDAYLFLFGQTKPNLGGKSQNVFFLGIPERKLSLSMPGLVSGYYLLLNRKHPMMLSQDWFGILGGDSRSFSDLASQEVSRITHIFQGILIEAKAKRHSAKILTTYLKLLSDWFLNFQSEQSPRPLHESHLIVNFKRELEAFYAMSETVESNLPSVKEIASRLKVNPNYLSHSVRKNTGKSAMEHIHAFVVSKAKHMLENSPATIGDIAFHLGFEYQNYFARVFRKETGMSPSQYRSRIAR